MFTSLWEQRKTSYDFVVIGSGYGGAITAARLASAKLSPKPSVCILERGKERWPGNLRFPDTLDGVMDEFRSEANPLGLYELLNYADITVVKGCGLGGTSLINANVAATPDAEVFEQADWPQALRWENLRPFYDRARQTLGPGPTRGRGPSRRCRRWTGGRSNSASTRSHWTWRSTSRPAA